MEHVRSTSPGRSSTAVISREEGLHILSVAENLTECTLSLLDLPDQSQLSDLETVWHLRLRSFTLHSCGSWHDYPEILALLTFPALRKLQLRGIQQADARQLTPFLSRHSALLQTFSLGPSACVTTAISVDSLRHMPHLTDLELSGAEMSLICDIFSELEDPRKRFLPHIKNISFLRRPSTLDSADMVMLACGLSLRSSSQRRRCRGG
ncbi:hypothetical protein FB451DRAFT_160325 [Mycena latifolia]|nr:hypothetical protein FB451DRAFT_160325 [Mycena latifolia]